MTQAPRKDFVLAVLVAALGYFVDIYDLLLFSIVRVSSLKGLGVPENLLMEKGVLLINCQMAGLLLGGILWGVVGDKKGRLSVLFGSIFIYSVANILNAFVTNVEQYAALRFIAGLGLAGELGAGITLVSELMPQKIRGYGTTIVASVGILGAVVAALVGDMFTWTTAYIIGGSMGLALLVLRLGVQESGLFKNMKQITVSAGNFWALFRDRDSLKRYIAVILVGVPLWYTIGILITFSPEFGKAFQMEVLPSAGKAVMWSYLGLSIGDICSGLLSQKLQSRKKALLSFILLLAAAITSYFLFAGQSLGTYYFLCGVLGFAAGYWCMFVTVASEQFGTNIRATVTTTAPNFVRGAVIPLTILFQFLLPITGIFQSAIIVGLITIILALISVKMLRESFHTDLNFYH